MPTWRNIRGVVGNFLGAYTSRYSDYQGFWLFGFLVADLTEVNVDLLSPPEGKGHNASDVAIHTAISKFADQLGKARLKHSQIQQAELSIRKTAEPIMGPVNGRPCLGYSVNFRVWAVMFGGRRHEREQAVFVAPHDPAVELRSARA